MVSLLHMLTFLLPLYFIGDNRVPSLSQLLKNSNNLTYVTFESICSEGLKLIASYCGSSLRVIKAEVNSDSKEAIIALCKSCPNLTICDLQCQSEENINGDEVIQAAVRHCLLIEVLPIAKWTLTDAAVGSLATIHTLKVLKLSSSCTYAYESLYRALHANPSLEELEIHGKSHINATAESSIGRHCGNLRKVYIPHYRYTSYILDSQALWNVFHGCRLLEEVSLHCIVTNATLRTLFQYCRCLSKLNISCSEAPIVILPVDNEPILYDVYPSLTSLGLCHTFGGTTSVVFRDIFTYFTSLRTVDLAACSLVTDDLLLTLTHTCCKLEVLYFFSCANVTVAGLLEALSHCPTIRELYVSCLPFDDEALVQVSLICPKLNKFALYSCTGFITEIGVLAVADTCTQLRVLTLSSQVPKIPLTPALKLLNDNSVNRRLIFSIDT